MAKANSVMVMATTTLASTSMACQRALETTSGLTAALTRVISSRENAAATECIRSTGTEWRAIADTTAATRKLATEYILGITDGSTRAISTTTTATVTVNSMTPRQNCSTRVSGTMASSRTRRGSSPTSRKS
jgi:hypothetical protein